MSYKTVFEPLDIPEQNILSYLYPPNQTVSDKPIWIDAGNPAKSLSPRQMLLWVRRLGYGLDKLGIAKGAVVVIITPNHLFVPVAYQGIVGSGRIFSGVNPNYTVPEIEHQIRDTEAKVLLVHPSLLRTAVEAGRRAGLSKDRIFQFSDHRCSPVDDVLDWRTMLGSEGDASSWKWDDMKDSARSTIATINYSSGTTGLPKGVCISHYNLIANIEQTIFMRDLETSYVTVPASRPEERWIGFLPLYHAYGKLSLSKRWCRIADSDNRPIVCVSHGLQTGFSYIHHAEVRFRRLPGHRPEIPNHASPSGPADIDHA